MIVVLVLLGCYEANGCFLSLINGKMHLCTPRKLTLQWKIHHLKMYFLLNIVILNVMLVFRGCTPPEFRSHGSPVSSLDFWNSQIPSSTS